MKESNILLSIVIITMNRSEKLKKAIESCLICNLPYKTEIIIIDNGSTDCTSETIAEIQKTTKNSIKYHKLQENIGVGAGRNKALESAGGKYIYILDDDAYISNNKNFFIDALSIMDKNRNIATLTTQIYDFAWKRNRIEERTKEIGPSLFLKFYPCGGSHFLRKEYFEQPVYYPNKYGYEEIATAMQAYREGYINAFANNLLVYHDPIMNKWDMKKNKDFYIKSFACEYAIKAALYPAIMKPILKINLYIRCYKHLKTIVIAKKSDDIISYTHSLSQGMKKINLATVIMLFKNFGRSIL